MSTVPSIRADTYRGLTVAEEWHTRRLVCGRADDVDDAVLLLDMLGLLPPPTPTASEGQQ